MRKQQHRDRLEACFSPCVTLCVYVCKYCVNICVYCVGMCVALHETVALQVE